jgi:uncharacterized protein (TIGR00251 family)
MASFYTVKDGLIHLSIKASPGASVNAYAGVEYGQLRIRIAAAPEDNRANNELVAFLAESLGLAKRDVVLISGEKSRNKVVTLPLSVKAKIAAMG